MHIEQTVVVPELHPELHKDARLGILCPDLVWLNPLAGNVPGLASPWPLSTAEAAACLREAEQWAESGLTDTEARSRHLLARTEEKTRQENRAVREACLATGAVRSAEAVPPSQDVLREAQRLLLFVWAQEERLLEIRRLAVRYAHEARRLQDVLRDDETEEAPVGVTSPAFVVLSDRDEEYLLPAWQPVLERLALFLSPDAALCTRDRRIIEHLHEANLCLEPLASAGLSCPRALRPLRGQLLGERLPMWRILGYSHAQAGRPWLDTERLFLILMPGGTDAHA